MMVINNENIEEYLLLLIDGELSSVDELEVMTFIEAHNEYQLLLDRYLDAKLDVDDSIVFEDKESLLKPETQILHFSKERIVYYRAAVAAVVILLTGIAFRIAVVDKKVPQQSIVLHAEKKKSIINTLPEKALVSNVHKEASGKPGSRRNNRQAIEQIQSSKNAIIENDTERHIASLKPLPVVDRSALAVNAAITVNAEKISLPDYPEMEMTATKQEGLLNNGNRMDAVNALLARVEALKDNIENKTKGLKNMTVAIRLGGKEFTIGK